MSPNRPTGGRAYRAVIALLVLLLAICAAYIMSQSGRINTLEDQADELTTQTADLYDQQLYFQRMAQEEARRQAALLAQEQAKILEATQNTESTTYVESGYQEWCGYTEEAASVPEPDATAGPSSGSAADTAPTISESPEPEEPAAPILNYIGNLKTHKFHEKNCSYLPENHNRTWFASSEEALSAGYSPCAHCEP